MKIYELAKEIGVDSKDIVEFLKKEGVDVKNHMSTVPEDMFIKIKSNFSGEGNASEGLKDSASPVGTDKKTSGVKAVAVNLPENVLRQVEEEKAQKEKAQAEKKEAEGSLKEEEKAQVPQNKKKKVHVKINTQNSSAYKTRQAQSQKSSGSAAKVSSQKTPTKKWVSARDRVPDDVLAERKKEQEEAAKKKALEEEKAKEAAAEAERLKEEEEKAAEEKKTEEEALKSQTPAAEETAQKDPAKEALKGAPDVSEPEQEKAPEAEVPAKEAAFAAAETEKPETSANVLKEAAAPASAKAEASKEPVPAKETVSAKEGQTKENPSAKQAKPQGQTKTQKSQNNKNSQNYHKNKYDSKKSSSQKSTQKIESVSKIAEEKKPKVLGHVEPVSESQAVKSLREKLVKGTVNKEDLLGNQKKGSSDRSHSGQKGQYNKKGQYNQNRNQDKSSSGHYDKYEGKSSGQKNRRKDSMSEAPVMDTRSSRKGGKSNKDKYDKKGDKFDRLENEKAIKNLNKPKAAPKEEEIKVITLPESISIKDFAEKLKMKPADLIKKLFLEGKTYTVNDVLDFETAEEIALEMDIIAEKEEVVDYVAELLKEEPDPEESLVKRPPVVCVMGHVDHGKTSLLDAIRNTNVTAGEAGGITQHIGAYTVNINGESITFLDTPGHEAFTAMRLRGAMATDVAILVVAADDGVMPQTIEAINHAKAANIHVIVAVNKIDKPGADVERVKQQLTEYGLVPEEWGGDTIFVPVSAKTGEGIQNLLEMVILDTEILELKANPHRMARGVVIEAKVDKGRGSVATLLVQKGTLKVGDHVAMGESYGRVRSMLNDKGQRIKEAGPSTPVEISGLNGIAHDGDTFVAYKTDKEAKEFAQVFVEENKKKLLAGTKAKMSLDDVFDQMKAGELKELNIIVKADVAGSAEALKQSLEKLSNDEVVVRCIHTGVGNVSESDAILASASNAIIIAFDVGVNVDARSTIEHEKVDMRSYSIIYDAIDDVELAMKGMLEPIYEESIIGHIEVRQIFKASGVGVIAGSYVSDGIVKRSAKVRLSREGEQLFDGEIASLKRFNDDAKEVKAGYECGIVLKDFSDIKEGDTMEVYEMKEVSRE